MRSKIKPYLLLLPFLLLMAIFIIGVIGGVLQSLGYIPAFGLNTLTFKYYLEVFKDSQMMSALVYSLWIALSSSVIAIILGTLISFLLCNMKKTNSAFASIIKLPIQIPPLIVAVFVLALFSNSGIFSRILYNLGFISGFEEFPRLLYDENGFGIILSYVWKETAFVCFFVMTLMSKITSNLEETAMSLGANKLKVFTNITLPLCKKTILNSFFIIFAFSFGSFELPFLLGSTAKKALPVITYIEYTNSNLQHRPYAMVLNVIMIIVGLIISALYYNGIKDSKKYD